MLEWGFAQVDQQWFNTPALLAEAERMYAEVKPLQPKYWRIGAAWPLIAKTRDPGTFVAGTPPTSTGRDWSTLDTSLNEGLLLGCDIVLILGVRKASWGGFQFGPFSFGATVGTAADFAAFCTEVATRYKVGGVGIRTDGRYAPNSGKGVHIFEIWNEQNDQNHWGGQISAQDYTNHLIAGYDAIKAVSGLSGTNSRVLFGGTYHVQRQPPWWGYGIASLPEVEFLTQCYTYGAKDKFDAMNIHLYPNLDDLSFNGSDLGPAPTMNTDNLRQLVDIRALMVSKGDGAKKISVTEAGFPVSVVGEALQKTYWETLWALLSALSYVDMVLFYCARDGGGAVDSENGSLGAMRADFSHRPVWEWLQTLTPPAAVYPVFTGSGVLAATVKRVVTAAFSGSGTLAGRTPPQVTAAFAGAGELSALADKNSNERSPAFTGEGALSATVKPSLSVTSSFTGLGSLTATTKPSLSVTAPFTGSGALSSAAQAVGAGRNADFTGTGTLSMVAVAPVLWNSTGAGGRTATTAAGGKSVSWSHNTTVTGTDVWAFAELGYSYGSGLTALSAGCNYGSTPMTILGFNSSGSIVFGLQNPPTGSQTVTATITPTGGVIHSWQGTSVSFTNVGEVVTPLVTANGGTATVSVTAAASPGSRVLGVSTAAGQIVSVSHTQRYSGGGSVTGSGDYVAVQDGPGEVDGFVTLTAALLANAGWNALAVVLNPVIPAPTATAALSGSGTWSCTVTATPVRTADFTGSGALTATGVGSYSRTPAFTGSGTLSAVGFELYARAGAFTGAGTLTAPVSGNPPADFTGSGTLAASTVVVLAAAASLTGAGALSAVLSTAAERTADFTGSGSLSALAIRQVIPALSGAGTLSCTVTVPPAYNATGGGNIGNNSFNPDINVTWSHTASGSNRAVVVAFSSRCGGQTPSGQTRTVTYGGVTMTQLATITYGSDMFTDIYGLLNPATGAQTVSVTVGNGSNTGRALAGNSTSWTGVSAFGATATNSGTGTSGSLSITSAAGEWVAQAFGVVSQSFSAYTQTQRYNAQSGDGFARLLLGDAAGATSTSFGVTNGGSAAWGGVAARLTPV